MSTTDEDMMSHDYALQFTQGIRFFADDIDSLDQYDLQPVIVEADMALKNNDEKAIFLRHAWR